MRLTFMHKLNIWNMTFSELYGIALNQTVFFLKNQFFKTLKQVLT